MDVVINKKSKERKWLAVEANQLHARFLEYLVGEVVRIGMRVHHPGNTGIDDHFRADHAGLVCAVKRRAVDADSELSRLYDGVLFGVYGVTKLMLFAGRDIKLLAQALAFFLAAFDARGRAVVARGQYTFVSNDDGSDAAVFLKAA